MFCAYGIGTRGFIGRTILHSVRIMSSAVISVIR
jgi:hypothetical protein